MNFYELMKSNLNEADDYSEDEPIEVPVSKEEQRIIDFANEVVNDLKATGYKVGRVETEDSKYPIYTISKNRFSADIEFSNPTLAAGALKDNENLKEAKGETYKLIHADSDKISELEKGSAFTWEGMEISDKNLKAIVDFFKKNTKGFKTPVTMYNWTGKEFNEKYGLTGSNAYQDNINFLSIPLDAWSEVGNLPMVKFQVGARWLDDIVDNNARREQDN